MHQIYSYEIYIFDCDGVILDSNTLKIQAMKKSLEVLCFESSEIEQCINYFANNFGKSRFHHVEYFIESILNVKKSDKDIIAKKILKSFSKQCKELYLTANLTPGFLEMIQSLPGRKYVASGSEQNELRSVFKARGLDQYFVQVFGSPTAKSSLLANILKLEIDKKAVMIGDAVSDFEASRDNEIDFVCYIPFSNVTEKMQMLAVTHNFDTLQSWPYGKFN
ncbi:MAG: HAD hydrolase-like protein [Colwellia polaris]